MTCLQWSVNCHYLQKCKQRTKNGIAYSLWEETVSGIPQGAILGRLVFNIFLSNLFLSTKSKYFANYADDTTPYVIGNDAEEVVSKLKTVAEKLFIWFHKTKWKQTLINVICFLVQPKPSLTSKYQRQ